MSGYVGIFDRVNLLLRASINDLLDRALSTNKPAVFDEQVNQLQGALDTLNSALGETIGRRTTLEREISQLEAAQAKIDGELDRLILMEDTETDLVKKAQIAALATSHQSKFNSNSDLLEMKLSQLEQTGKDVAQLTDSQIKLSARIDTIKAQKGKLLALIAERKAAEAQGRALSMADIRTRFSPEDLIREEQEAVERAKGIVSARGATVSQAIDDLLDNAMLQQQLEERRARLKGAR